MMKIFRSGSALGAADLGSQERIHVAVCRDEIQIAVSAGLRGTDVAVSVHAVDNPEFLVSVVRSRIFSFSSKMMSVEKRRLALTGTM